MEECNHLYINCGFTFRKCIKCGKSIEFTYNKSFPSGKWFNSVHFSKKKRIIAFAKSVSLFIAGGGVQPYNKTFTTRVNLKEKINGSPKAINFYNVFLFASYLVNKMIERNEILSIEKYSSRKIYLDYESLVEDFISNKDFYELKRSEFNPRKASSREQFNKFLEEKYEQFKNIS